MRDEKKYLAEEVGSHLEKSEYCIIANYHGIKVDETMELRAQLADCGAEFHVVKNSAFGVAAKTRGLPDLSQFLDGPTAIVVGGTDPSAAAKQLKRFYEKKAKVAVKAALLGDRILTTEQLSQLAELPSLEVLRSLLLCLLNSPASSLLSLLTAPSRSMVNLLQAKAKEN
ncbi:MAG: 50S ribosomal protein L10 [Opitutales bacterium]